MEVSECLSETGKWRQLYFKTRDKAKAEAQRLRANGLRYILKVIRQCVEDGHLRESPCKRIQRARRVEKASR